MANTFFLILVFILVLCYPYYSVAFVIPDVNNIGKDPKIYSVSPRYLIPGDRVKIIGENFLASPKTANKLFINGKKVRILSATNNELEFIVPKLPLGEGKIVLFTHYLGLKSQEEIYPNHSTNGFYITFKAPEVLGVNSIEVKPNQKLTVFGNFNLKKEVYFKLDNGIFKGKIFSNRSAELVLPDKLPLAPIPLKMFYRKTVLKKGTQLFFDSAFSDDLTLYNIEFGEPQYLNISIENSVFDVIPDKELSYRVELIYGNGKKTDVTDFVAIEMIGDEIAKIDKVNKKLKVHAGGIVTLKAMFLWEPISKMLEDTQDIVVNLPRYPYFHEVVIDEIFPFASGFFSETDANGDGFAKLNDEFIELKNLTGETLDLSNCKFYINEKKEASVVLSDLTVIKPYEYFVIYGDMAEEDSLNLSNSGAVVELICNEQTIDYVAYPKGANGDHSWQRNPTLDSFKEHPGKLFSPGQPPPQVAVTGCHPDKCNDEGSDAEQDINDDSDFINEEDDSNEDIILGIEIVPSALTVLEFEQTQIKVNAILSSEAIVDVTQLATYKIIAGDDVISINNSGFLTPIMNGNATVQVEYEGISSKLSVDVNIQSSVMAGDIIINEVLAAPEKDVNGDGVFDSTDDEFIEIVNISNDSLDIGGLVVSDKTKVRHVIPLGTILESFHSLVIFGGGDVSNSSSNFLIHIASVGDLGLNNSGVEQVTVQNPNGEIIDIVEFNSSGIKGVSLNREVDLEFSNLVSHDNLSTENYSPGRRVDLSPFF